MKTVSLIAATFAHLLMSCVPALGATPKPSPQVSGKPSGSPAATVTKAKGGVPEADWRILSKIDLDYKTNKKKKVSKEILDLMGKNVKVGGFMIVNEFDAGKIKEFLLSAVGKGCIHVPPPPPQYVISVKMQGKTAEFSPGPILVHGKIVLSKNARQAYEMVATDVEPYPLNQAQ